ncbi:MAG: transposase [Verrucomicrobiales bacterium]|nr:transposase [Verrucomicrobiales bacterium]
MRTKTKRDRRTRYPQHQIESLLQEFTASGLSVRRFALQHDLCPATLSRC